MSAEPTVDQIQEVLAALDPEAAAVQTLVEAPLDDAGRARVINLAYSRFIAPSKVEGDDDPTPRTFWLDELPTERDLLHLGGADIPIAVSHESSGGEFTYRLSADVTAANDLNSKEVPA